MRLAWPSPNLSDLEEMESNFLIYGANGYTGELTARFAVARGLRPVLAGRNADQLEDLASRLDLEYRVFDLDETEALDRALSSVHAVLNCAGPFLHTHERMAAACLRTATHYLDITGEIPVYRALTGLDAQARDRGVMLLPGIGFDVVPTDCLAAHLKRQLPTARHLALAFCSVGPARISRGTGKTFVESLGQPGFVLKDGIMTPVPYVSKGRMIDFGWGPVDVPRLTLADVFTASHSTGIPNIESYFVVPAPVRSILKIAAHFGSFLSREAVQSLLKFIVTVGPRGPSNAQRDGTHTVFWGQVKDDQGNRCTSRLTGPEAYTFTALASLAAIQRVLSGEAAAGYQTPSSAFGADFVMEIEGVNREDAAQDAG